MFKLTPVIWIDRYLVSTSPLPWKKTTQNQGTLGWKEACSCQEGPGGVLQHQVISMIILRKMLQVERCQPENGNRTTRSNQLQWESSWLELVRHCAKMPLAPSPIFINFAILGKDRREFPVDCDSLSEIWSWPAGEGSRQTDWQRDSVLWGEEARLSGLCRKGRKRPVLSDKNLGGQSSGARGKEVEEQTNYRHCVRLDAPTDWLAHVSEALRDGNQLIILINFSPFVIPSYFWRPF